MKAITLKRPWAQALVFGPKDVENRSYRWHGAPGWLAIHAGQSVDESYDYHAYYEPDPALDFPGRVIGFVFVQQCVHVDDARVRSPWAQGPVQWEVTRKVNLVSVAMAKVRGWPGLFDVDYEVEEVFGLLRVRCGAEDLGLFGEPSSDRARLSTTMRKR